MYKQPNLSLENTDVSLSPPPPPPPSRVAFSIVCIDVCVCVQLDSSAKCRDTKLNNKESRGLSLLSLLISLSLGETLLLEPFDGKVYDLLPVFLPELWSCPSNHLCLAPIFCWSSSPSPSVYPSFQNVSLKCFMTFDVTKIFEF